VQATTQAYTIHLCVYRLYTDDVTALKNTRAASAITKTTHVAQCSSATARAIALYCVSLMFSSISLENV